jgi:hypothetical protein
MFEGVLFWVILARPAAASHKVLPSQMGPMCDCINRSNSSAKNRTIQAALST